jgi:hypothetical protein
LVKVVKTKKVYYRLPKIREFQKNLLGLALSKCSGFGAKRSDCNLFNAG